MQNRDSYSVKTASSIDPNVNMLLFNQALRHQFRTDVSDTVDDRNALDRYSIVTRALNFLSSTTRSKRDWPGEG